MGETGKSTSELIKDLIEMRRECPSAIAEIYRENTKMIIQASKQIEVSPSFQSEHEVPELLPEPRKIQELNIKEIKEKMLLAKILRMKKNDPVWSNLGNL